MSDAEKKQEQPISAEELRQILQDHETWAESDGKQGAQADLHGRNLLKANLKGTNLRKANLKGANLLEANLEGANLLEANLNGARLIRANLKRAYLVGAELDNALLAHTVLREADLRDAGLEKATGLLAEQLAGSNVSGARLPRDVRQFYRVTRADESAKSAKTIFFLMLLGCAYSALTIFSTTDTRLLTNSASSPLPIIGTAIPIAGFFGVAPGLLLGTFVYFHIYLQRLWEQLAELPAVFPDGAPLDKCVYPWFLVNLVRPHFVLLRDKDRDKNGDKDRPAMSGFQNLMAILLGWCTVPFTIMLFWLRYLPIHDWLVTALHIGFLTISVVSAIWFFRLAAMTLQGKERKFYNWKRALIDGRTYKALAFLFGSLVIFYVVSAGAIFGIPSDEDKAWPPIPPITVESFHRPFDLIPLDWIPPPPLLVRQMAPWMLESIGFRAFANIAEEDVSIRPANWFTRPDDELTRVVNGAQLRGKNLQHASAFRAFLVNGDLRNSDLRHANLFGAHLENTNLRLARLENADLESARLENANLNTTFLQNANLSSAYLQNADLRLADLGNADLRLARLENADLRQADLRNADLSSARLENADLRQADLRNADLRATLENADLSSAHLENADLRQADLRNADLSSARLENADLLSARLENANLSQANLRHIQNWRAIESIAMANFYEVTNAPDGFLEWAEENGAVFLNWEDWRVLNEEETREEKK